jgi:hypothetical protein
VIIGLSVILITTLINVLLRPSTAVAEGERVVGGSSFNAYTFTVLPSWNKITYNPTPLEWNAF